MKTLRRTVAAGLLATVVLLVPPGCSSSGHDAPASPGTGSSEDVGGPDRTLSNSAYAARLETFTKALTRAGNDGCAVSEVLEADLPDPENKIQTKAYVDAYEQVLRSVAAVLAGSPAADALGRAATNFRGAAVRQDYSEDLLDSDAVSDIMTSSEMKQALTEFGTLSTRCAATEGDGSGAGSVPGAPPRTSADGGEVPFEPPVFGREAG